MSKLEPMQRRTRAGIRRHRWIVATIALVAGSASSLGGLSAAVAADTIAPYTGQPDHPSALYGVVGPNNAGGQEFAVAAGDSDITDVSVWLGVTATTGSITADLRTKVDDPSTSVAASTQDIARDLGGSGSGWVRFPFTTTVSPGEPYYLVLQASVPAGTKVAWYGSKTPTAGSPSSWNYDVSYYGGWFENAKFRPAFYVNPTGDEACGDPYACYKGLPGSVTAEKMAGLYDNGETTAAISNQEGWGSSYVDDSNVLQLSDGQWRYLPTGATAPVTVAANDPGALRQIAASRAWLASGTVPGRTAEQRAVAARALLAMRALTQPNGAVAAAWNGIWEYSWPRDSSFVAAAFAATGHVDEAYAILRFDASTQRADGTWDARTTLDGSGPPDGRHWQLDANGWVPWAIWQWYQKASSASRDVQLQALYPALKKAADYAAASLDPSTGLPPASPDYWEVDTTTANIGTAAPLLAGLNAAADLARRTGDGADQRDWAQAARALSAGIAQRFAPNGYPRTVDNLHGRDSAVSFMAPPFNTAPADLSGALSSTWDALLQPQGGVVPGNGGSFTTAWTPSTTFFALAWAGTGDASRATTTLDWVMDHRNWLGELPEQVDADGNPSSVVPLAWTDSLVLMTMSALDGNGLQAPPFAVEPAVSSTTTLAVSAPSQRFGTDDPARLTATVMLASGAAPEGTVAFQDASGRLGTAAVRSDGTAAIAIPADTPVGHRRFTATYTPKDATLVSGSTSRDIDFTVLPSLVAQPIVMTIDGRTPGVLVAGTSHVVEVAGLQPDSSASLSIRSETVALGTATTDADGIARFTVVVPGSIGTGGHVLVLQGKNSLGDPASPQWAVTVQAPAGNAGTLASTGTTITGTAAVALLLLVAGAGLTWGRRRRRIA